MSCDRESSANEFEVFGKDAKVVQELVERIQPHIAHLQKVPTPNKKEIWEIHPYLLEENHPEVVAASDVFIQLYPICAKYGINEVYLVLQKNLPDLTDEWKRVLAENTCINLCHEKVIQQAVFAFVMKIVKMDKGG